MVATQRRFAVGEVIKRKITYKASCKGWKPFKTGAFVFCDYAANNGTGMFDFKDFARFAICFYVFTNSSNTARAAEFQRGFQTKKGVAPPSFFSFCAFEQKTVSARSA
jgi:hypothetical protein